MKTLVQVNIYRWHNGQIEFLLLKRTKDSGNFWQPVTGHFDVGESIGDMLKREVIEETGIHKIKDLTEQLYSYEWYSDDQREKGNTLVFGAEVRPEIEIKLNTKEHKAFEWLSYTDALKRLKWDGSKESLRRLYAQLENQQNDATSDTDEYSEDPGF